jgi:hypothetical protein
VLKDTYDHSCRCARSDEHQHVMTDWPPAIVLAARSAPPRVCSQTRQLSGERAREGRTGSPARAGEMMGELGAIAGHIATLSGPPGMFNRP